MARAATAAKVAEKPAVNILHEVRASPVIVLTDPKKREAFFVAIEADAFQQAGTDFTSQVGLDRVKAAAYALSRIKSDIERAGKSATEEWRRLTGEVNVNRNIVKAKLEDLQTRVRAPATEAEAKEAARKAEADSTIDKLRSAAIITVADNIESVQAKLDEIRGLNINDEVLRDRTQMAVEMRDDAVKALTDALAGMKQQQEEKEELERLRADRQRREDEEAERQRRADADKEEAKRQRDAEEAATRQREADAAKAVEEAERKAQEKLDEAARVEREAEAKREYARRIIDHIKGVGLGLIGGQPYPYALLIVELEEKIVIDEQMGDLQEEVRTIRDATLANVKAAMEMDRKKQADEARREEEVRVARENAERAANQNHRTNVRTQAKEAIMTCGADEETARKIVLAIQAGEVPHVTLSF